LAEKINNGVRIVKDGKILINKKTLETFMSYACTEASKQAEKGARGIYIDDPVVYGWAIHYFEEDSIEGTLFNEDGTEHKPAPKYTPPKTVAKPTAPTPPQPKNMTLFDLMDNQADVKTDEVPGELVKVGETLYADPKDGVVHEIETETETEKESEVDIYNLDDF
jgi:hypothetical protein